MQDRFKRHRFATRTASPRFEALEGRLCLSVTVTTLPADGGGRELKIVGNGAADTVTITDSGNGHVEVTGAGGNLIGASDNVSVIRFNGKTGADTVNYNLANPLAHKESVFFELGSRADNVSIDLSQGINGKNLDFEVDGGDGKDTISAILGSVTNAKVDLDIDGGAGADSISVSGTGVNVDANSVLRVTLLGSEGKDAISADIAGQILGKLVYNANGGPGIDTVTTNLTADPLSTGTLKATERGGGGGDTVTLNVIDNSGGSDPSTLAALDATLFDYDQLDTLTHTDNVVVVTTKPV
jgi:hypothetical protein